ncbi:MAG: hypothetical protein ACYTHJ_13125 [Planctomycetota bacterium]|jgi:hypothetical protein
MDATLIPTIAVTAALTAPFTVAPFTMAQVEFVLEDYEFATSDEAAAAGVIDRTDAANRPAFYINGECDIPPSPCDEVAVGLYSIGTDAAFCQQWCEAGSRIGFRRNVDPVQFPQMCAGQPFAPLVNSYGDPNVPGSGTPDFPLSALSVVVAVYGDGSFADGPTGTNLIFTLVDCDGEIYEFTNFSEPSLYQDPWTFDVLMGADQLRISPDSLVDGVPIGDGLLTGIVAHECFIQDDDNPPTSFGKWYIDDLRIVEPDPPGDIPAVSTWGLAIMLGLMLTAGTLVLRPPSVLRA